MLKNDTWIRAAANAGMIIPFTSDLIRTIRFPTETGGWQETKLLSYGCSSYGYDLRLSPKEFLVFRHIPGSIMDPKAFNPLNLESVPLNEDENGCYFVLPAHSYGLGVALEHLRIPSNITCLFIGKSTYARCGIVANTTPGEAGWHGHLTLEFSNSSGADCRIYANEGIVQALFFEGDPCETSYSDRSGKYQHQPERVTTARV